MRWRPYSPLSRLFNAVRHGLPPRLSPLLRSHSIYPHSRHEGRHQRLCAIAPGVDALRLIAAELADRQGVPEARRGQHLTRSHFDRACERLTVLGAALKAERDACWVRFVELRAEYEVFLSSLAASLLVPAHGSLLLPLAAADEEAL